jgi:hypothetical protein
MMLAGVIVTFLGWVIAVASVGVTSSVGGRMVMVLAGIAVSLVGIIGLLNRALMKKAIWRE